MEVKQCVIVHSVEIAAKLLQKFLKERGVDTYLLDKTDYDDFGFILNDVRPEVFLVHQTVMKDYENLIKKQLKNFEHIKLGYIGENSPPKGHWDIIILEPFDPALIYDQICSQLYQNLN